MMHHQTGLHSRAIRRVSSVLLTLTIFQGGLLHGQKTVNAAPAQANPAGNSAESARATGRLSPSEFVAPPPNARPGGFWDWLNGSISKEQITRDLEAMQAGGMRGCEIWDVAACADPDGRVSEGDWEN